MKKLISKLKEVPDLESKHPWQSQNHSQIINNDNINSINSSTSPNHSHLNNFIGKKFTVGRFVVTVEEIIAEGGFGIVFKTRSQNDQIYALKRLNVNNKRDLKVCKREITIMSSLTHKNILSLVDSQIYEHRSGIHELLMLLAYCPNNVAQLMRSKQQMQQHLPENVVIKILCDIIEAVARLHYCLTPVIHRDLKVENILIDDRNNYVLCDFGSATARHIVPSEYGITRTDEEISKYTTVAYRSPEMVNLGSQLIDCKADVWALGCLLYYLCFFTLPFGDKLLAIQSGKFSIPRSDISYSCKILKLIQYMLTVDPVQRPSVYQVSVLAFSIMNKKSPVPNFDRELVPSWEELHLPSDAQSPQKENIIIHTSSMKTDPDQLQTNKPPPVNPRRSRSMVPQTKTVSTSVNPRDRPKALKAALGQGDPVHLLPDRSPSLGVSLSHSLRLGPASAKIVPPPLDIDLTETLDLSVDSVGHSDDGTDAQSTNVTNLNVDRNILQKPRIGHRRMVSETSSKVIIEESIKGATSLFELTNQSVPDAVHVCPDAAEPPASLAVPDDEENDAFGEEFDRIRHQSGLSMNGDQIFV